MAKSKSRGNGEGTIYEIPKRGLWAAQYTVGRNADGKLKRRTVYGKTRGEVKKKLDGIVSQLHLGEYSDPSRITVAEYIKSLIDEDYALNVVNDDSYTRKVGIYNRIAKAYLGSLRLQAVQSTDIIKYLSGITNMSDSVISKDYALIKRCFMTAQQKNLITKNPMVGVRKPRSMKQTRKIRALSVDEQKRLMECLQTSELNSPYNTQLRLMMLTGMRMGEINALDYADINMTFKTINIHRTVTKDLNDHAVIGKTTKTYAGQRLLQMSPSVEKLLSNYLSTYKPNSENLLFYDYRARKVINTSQVNMYLQRVLKKYDILDDIPGSVTLHSLRHTFATRCIESGMPVKVLQKQLGHTDIKTTLDTYCDVFEAYSQSHMDAAETYLAKQGII